MHSPDLPDVPDAASTALLAELLKSKRNGLPIPVFSKEHPCELGLLIGMLSVRCADGERMGAGHMLHAAICMLANANLILASQCTQVVNDSEDPATTLMAVNLATQMTLVSQARDTVAQAMEFWADFTDTDFDGAVSDRFLESVGMSREDYEAFRAKCRSIS